MDELAYTTNSEYDCYDTNALQRVQQCFFLVYKQVMQELGQNQNNMEHIKTREAIDSSKYKPQAKVDMVTFDTLSYYLFFL